MENKARCKRFHQLNKEHQLLEAFLNDAPDCLVDNQSSTTTNQCDATSSEINRYSYRRCHLATI